MWNSILNAMNRLPRSLLLELHHQSLLVGQLVSSGIYEHIYVSVLNLRTNTVKEPAAVDLIGILSLLAMQGSLLDLGR